MLEADVHVDFITIQYIKKTWTYVVEQRIASAVI